MSFRDRTWSKRFAPGGAGDEAESVFETVYKEGFVRYGINRPPIHVPSIPPFIRFTPDYLTSKGLVEVQGFGRDQTFKLKDSKLEVLVEWSALFRVDIFVWDSHHSRYGWLRLPDLRHALAAHGEKAAFPEGTAYRALRAEHLPVAGGWQEVGRVA